MPAGCLGLDRLDPGRAGGADPGVAGAVIAGLARGWPEGRPAALDAAIGGDPGPPAAEARPRGEGGSWSGWPTAGGPRGSSGTRPRSPRTLLAQARDESRPDAARIDAARQYVELRKKDPDAARELIALVTPRTPPALATALIEAVGPERGPGRGRDPGGSPRGADARRPAGRPARVARPGRLDRGAARRRRGGQGPARRALARPEAGPGGPPGFGHRRAGEAAARRRAAGCPTPTARR